MQEKRMELLDTIASMTGYSFLSSLRQPENSLSVSRAVARLDPENFTLREWEEAANYLLGGSYRFSSPKEAFSVLLHELDRRSAFSGN